MSVALRKQLALKPARPETSFGPFRLLHALPWLILAAAMRVIAWGGGGAALPALIVADIAILLAFFATAQRSIEVAGGQSSLGELTLVEQIRFAFSILWRVALMMITAAVVASAAGFTDFAPHLLAGLDGMAFDQHTQLGRFWSAGIAALVLLIIVHAERGNGEIALFAALAEFARRAAMARGRRDRARPRQHRARLRPERSFARQSWCTGIRSSASQFTKNLIYFVFVFSFGDAAAVDHTDDPDPRAEAVIHIRD